MSITYKKYHAYLDSQRDNKNVKIFVKCDDYKLNMFYNFRRNITMEELQENKFVQYGYSMRAGDDSFHEAIKFVMCFAQFFGIMPVCGILNSNINRIKFKWLSLRTILMMVLAGFGCIELGYVLKAFAETILTILITYLYYSFTFFKLAKAWPIIIKKWRQAEDRFLQRPYTPYKGYSLIFKIRTVGYITIFLSLKHSLILIISVYKAYKNIIVCNLDVELLDHFIDRESHRFPIPIDFNFGWFLLSEWLTVSWTFCWNYADIFISLISICLAHRFNQINQRLAEMEGKNPPEAFWMEIRSHYIVMIELLELIDNKLSFLIPISCLNNLYFICVQLFNSFNPMPDLMTKIYFYGALIYVISRYLLLLLSASYVHEVTKIPLKYFHRVPMSGWNMEIQHFYELVAHNTIALSGRKFFLINKSVILAIIGTVITYELVLFDLGDREENVKYHCD